MFMKEPKAEFVPIDLKITATAASSCPDYVTQNPTGGGQRCIGTQIDARTCSTWDDQVPDWDDTENTFNSAPRIMRHR